MRSSPTLFYRMSDLFHYERKEYSSGVVLWRLQGPSNPSAWAALLNEATQWMSEQESRGKRWAFIIDPSEMTKVSAAARRMAGEWRRTNMPLIANVCSRACYVADSPMIRGAITAVLWFAQPVVDVSVRATKEEAFAWITGPSDRKTPQEVAAATREGDAYFTR